MQNQCQIVATDGTVMLVDVLFKADGVWVRCKEHKLADAIDGWTHWRDLGPVSRRALVKKFWIVAPRSDYAGL